MEEKTDMIIFMHQFHKLILDAKQKNCLPGPFCELV